MRFTDWVVWWSFRAPALILIAFVLSLAFGGSADLNAGLIVAGFVSVLWFVFICCVGMLIRIFAPPKTLAKINREAQNL